MQKISNDLLCDTATATNICNVTGPGASSDPAAFNHESNGRFFTPARVARFRATRPPVTRARAAPARRWLR
jgi:hypothetical protein